MVLEANVVDVRICSLSLHRHKAAHLVSRARNKSNNLPVYCQKRNNMASNPDRQSLPQVELRPFSKKVWRREKSLPDFYEKKAQEEAKSNPKDKAVEGEPPVSREVLKEWEEENRVLETRQNTMDLPSSRSIRSHPRAEFYSDTGKLTWRPHDLIPSFITRIERTKTTLDSLQRDTGFPVQCELTNDDLGLRTSGDSQNEDGFGFRIMGGKMSKIISKRHLLYLNPIDAYKQSAINSVGLLTRQNTFMDKSSLLSRNSFPLTSSRARELALMGSQQYPLRPIKAEGSTCVSPHKFNNKLGAAKNSLEVLSKCGMPTKLEKNLEKEYEMNLERFRKDRFCLPSDSKSFTSTYVAFDSSPTRGEMSLKQAREANKVKIKRRAINTANGLSLNGNAVRSRRSRRTIDLNEFSDHSEKNSSPTSRSSETSAEIVYDVTFNSTFVNPVIHPLDRALLEESESRTVTDVNLAEVLEDKILDPSIVSTDVDGKGKDGTEPSRESMKRSILHSSSKDNLRNGTVDKRQAEVSEKDERVFIKDENAFVTSRSVKSTLRGQGRSRSMDCVLKSDLTDNDTWRSRDFTDSDTDRDGGRLYLETEASDVELSPAANAKTNVEYLHKLRVTGGLPLVRTAGGELMYTNEDLSEKVNDQLAKAIRAKVDSVGSENELISTSVKTNGLTHSASRVPTMNVDQSRSAPAQSKPAGPMSVTTGDNQPYVTSKPNSVVKQTAASSEKLPLKAIGQDPAKREADEVPNMDANLYEHALSQSESAKDNVMNQSASSNVPSRHTVTVNNLEVDDGLGTSPAASPDTDDEKSTAQTESEITVSVNEPRAESTQESVMDQDDTYEESGGQLGGNSGDIVENGKPLPVPVTGMTSVSGPGGHGDLSSHLDSSLDPLSDAEVVNLSTSVDNGDSGVSTTFLTAEDSKSELLSGLL